MLIADKILVLLLKDFSVIHTVTSIAKDLSLSRVGVWKSLKKLGSERLILLTTLNGGKTSSYIARLNFENILLIKRLTLYLAEEAQGKERWKVNFEPLERYVVISIIYGSILVSPNKANDIDILTVAKKENFNEINKTIQNIQKTQIRKIHAISFTEEELKSELKNNKAMIDAIKTGVILYGQENFIKFISEAE